MIPTWKSLIRFKDSSGNIKYGEPDANLKSATVYDGSNILNLRQTQQKADVIEVRGCFRRLPWLMVIGTCSVLSGNCYSNWLKLSRTCH